MANLANPTQSRLGVFIYDNDTSQVLQRIPVYSEITVTAKIGVPDYEISCILLQPFEIIGKVDGLDVSKLLSTSVSDDLKKINDDLSYRFCNSAQKIVPKYVLQEDFETKRIEFFKEIFIMLLQKLSLRISIDLSRKSNEGLDNDAREFVENIRSKTAAIDESTIDEIVIDIIKKVTKNKDGKPLPTEEKKYSYPLGVLATDHVGYCSFSLRNALLQFNRMKQKAQLLSSNFSIFVLPMWDENLRIDILASNPTYTPDAFLAKLNIKNPGVINNSAIAGMPSIQEPDLQDWYLSPASFAANPEALLGKDGCEKLFPANLALQEFRFKQVVRITDKVPEGYTLPKVVNKTPFDPLHPIAMNPTETNPIYKFGWIDEYKTSWYQLGHSLGQILYSLPLAPGETVKLAVIDWARQDITKRSEDTLLNEQLFHSEHRDRTITEIVKATLNEMQGGNSFMAGGALSLGGSLSSTASGSIIGGAVGGPVGAAIGAIGGAIVGGLTGAIGGGHSTSSGSRELATQNVQKISDNISQASSALRELHSTVVVQATQEENEKIETRTFSNYNHSHTLTVLYYEVLRHLRVLTEWYDRKPALLIRFAPLEFKDDNEILKYIKIIQPNLLDSSLNSGFDAMVKIERITADYNSNGINLTNDIFGFERWSNKDFEFTLFEFGIRLNDSFEEDSQSPQFFVKTIDGFIELVGDDGKGLNSNNRLHYKNDGDITYDLWFYAKPKTNETIKWGDIVGFEIRNPNGGNTDYLNWRIIKLNITAYRKSFNRVNVTKLFPSNDDLFGDVSIYFGDRYLFSQTISWIRRPEPDPETILTPMHSLSQDEKYSVLKLREHIQQNNSYYSRIIQLRKDPNNLAIDFGDKTKWGDLLDHITPTPQAFFGDYIAFPLIDQRAKNSKVDERGNPLPYEDEVNNYFTEKLITVPTRGVFAEGKLGYCNISEVIDNTRFWKWDEHPIPTSAPEIGTVTPVTPQSQTQNVQPTPFPQSLVNIVNPPSEPDPTGMAAALKVLGTPDIFRDMSMSKQLGDLLKDLSDNSVTTAEAAGKLAGIMAQQGQVKKVDSKTESQASEQSDSGGSMVNKSSEEIQKHIDNNNKLVGLADPEVIKKNANNLANYNSRAAAPQKPTRQIPKIPAPASPIPNKHEDTLITFNFTCDNNLEMNGRYLITIHDIVNNKTYTFSTLGFTTIYPLRIPKEVKNAIVKIHGQIYPAFESQVSEYLNTRGYTAHLNEQVFNLDGTVTVNGIDTKTFFDVFPTIKTDTVTVTKSEETASAISAAVGLEYKVFSISVNPSYSSNTSNSKSTQYIVTSLDPTKGLNIVAK